VDQGKSPSENVHAGLLHGLLHAEVTQQLQKDVASKCMWSYWQDKAASDSMEAAMDLMCLNGVVRKAINLVKGLEISFTDETFHMAITSIIPWFKVPVASPKQ
jgi:hypothetical protein